jgi:hypothetical protein
MTQPQIKNIFLILTSCLLFFVEIMLFALAREYIFYLVLCFFIALLLQAPQKRTLVTPLFLMCMLSYLEMNIFGWSLVYILPTIIFANYLDQHVRIKIIIPYLVLTFALCFKMLTAWYMHGITISIMHATQIIVYNTMTLATCLTIRFYLGKFFTKTTI